MWEEKVGSVRAFLGTHDEEAAPVRGPGGGLGSIKPAEVERGTPMGFMCAGKMGVGGGGTATV